MLFAVPTGGLCCPSHGPVSLPFGGVSGAEGSDPIGARYNRGSVPTTLEPGTSLSHYRIIAPIGAGGMGEVYKAQDTKLDRPVALKILPPELVRNDERVRRFMQEAKSASSLNHPHIVTIHEIGQSEAAEPDGEMATRETLHYMAMELVDGVTLKQKIHDEQTELRTLLVYLAQAADGLAKAHTAGIIHRDLKPENIMVTRDGFAKVLDFGLAKLVVPPSTGSTNAPTAVRNNTREGALVGTVAYMSPEQVKGKPVDHRSDVFSFGSILYEAATRRRPFEADSDIDVMHSIAHDKPVPIDELNAAVPAELRRLIRRCLAKDPDKRYQSMKDIANELTEIVDEFDELSVSASSRSSSSGETLSQSSRRGVWLALAAAAVITLAAVAFAVYQWRRSEKVPAAAPFASMKLSRLTSSGNVTSAAISPDGRSFAQVTSDADGRLTLSVRQIATSSDIRIVGPVDLNLGFPRFSPDGNYVYFLQSDDAGPSYQSLYQVPAFGGTPRKLVFDVDTAPTFSPDGRRIAFGRGKPDQGKNLLVVVNSDGSGERVLSTFDRLFGPIGPSWSPDGKWIVAPNPSLEGGVHTKLILVDPDSAEQRIIDKRWGQVNSAIWLPDGSGIALSSSNRLADRPQIWIQPYPEAEPHRVTNDLIDYDELTSTADGSSLLALRFERMNRLMISEAADETGGDLLTRADHLPWDVSVSRSGSVVYEFQHEEGIDLAIIDAPGAPHRILTTGGRSGMPSISADGRTIAFMSLRVDDVPHIFLMDADGRNVRQVTNGAGEMDPLISPDASTLLYANVDASLWRLALPEGEAKKVVDSVRSFAISDRHIAYGYNAPQGNRVERRLAVVPLDGTKPLLDIVFSDGNLRWTRDGGTLTFVTDSTPSQIGRLPLDGSTPEILTKFKSLEIGRYDWTSDGRLVMVRGETRSDAVLISGFR